jgi:hypothetical protein
MKKLLFSAAALFLGASAMFAQTANVQAIHNSPLVPTVDVYAYTSVGSVKAIEDFAYRTATPFNALPAGIAATLVLAPANSSSIADTISGTSIPIGTLTSGTNYILMVYGQGSVSLVSPALTASPNGAGTAALSFFHGGDDAPAVDVNVRGGGTLFDNVEFGDFDGYFGVNTATYVVDVFDSTSTTKVKSYYAPLGTASGAAAVIFASGYLNPTGSQPAFGVFVALPSGTVIQLPEIKSSLVQAIHNSPDPLAATVDAYIINNLAGTPYQELKANDVAYRNATAFLTVEYIPGTGTDSVTLALAPSTSASSSEAIYTSKYKLTPGTGYVLVAAGVLNTTGYNPAKPFGIYVFPGARPTTVAGPGSGNIDVNVFHGSTDAPEVQASITAPVAAAGNLGSTVEFGEFTGYTLVPFQNAFYTSQVAATGATFESTPLPLGLNPQANGLAFTLYVTGFVNPSNNNNGQSLQVCAASLSGNPVAGVGLLCYDLVLLTSVEEKVVNKMLMFPNPTQNNLSVEYTLESAQSVKYNVFNTVGQLVISGDAGTQTAGRNAINVNTSNLSTGQYVMQVLVGSEVNVTRTFIKE